MTDTPATVTGAEHAAGPVLVVLPPQPTAIHDDLLRVAREVARLGEASDVVALWASASPAQALADAGVAEVLRPVAAGDEARGYGAALEATLPAALADATLAAIDAVRPRVVLLVANPSATDVAGEVSVRRGCGAVVDVAHIAQGDNGLRVTREVLDSTWTTVAELTGAPGILTVQFGATVDGASSGDVAVSTPGGGAEIRERVLDVTPSPATLAVEVVDHAVPDAGEAPLTGAERVVVAGRGTQGDLTLVRELAARLDAAVGATRVVTENGWAPHEMQVGQSGVVIGPRLYLGVGVSGQVHHTMGIRGSTYIVAVCDDPDAPIFEMADFGVVGDLNEVIPQALEELRA